MARDALGRVLVTGANGFVGSHVVDALLRRGSAVRCALRPHSDPGPLPMEAVEVVRVDYDQPRTLDSAVRDCSGVVHVAGVTRAASEAAYFRGNVDTTAALAAACARTSPVPVRFVLVSSLAASGPSTRDRARIEDDTDAPVSAYGRSKLRGETALREVASDLSWTIVRPPAVYGPRDVDFLRLVRMVARGWAPRVGGEVQRLSLVHVHDLAQALVDALEHRDAHERTYFVPGPSDTDWDAIAHAMARALDNDVRILRIPPWTLPWVAWLSALQSQVLRRPNPLPFDRLADLRAAAWTCSGARIAKEIGFVPGIRLDDGIPATITWYREQGWLET